MSSPLNEAAMSPAISLFALACTALLGVAYGSSCATVLIGDRTDERIELPVMYVDINKPDALINIPDYCAARSRLLVGEEATVCDHITAPDITLGPALTPLTVHRTNALDDRAAVYIVQYCDVDCFKSNMSV
ncbi:uncharacterized protein [Choristoneura fumiferana]|uniref:uncharacterized protein n=1 Tax=Choristoneura fumiferana TaxID=7141 RepID=UPI003D15C098